MTLKDAITDIVRDSGVTILGQHIVVNMLSDYGIFKNNPSYRFIYQTLLNDNVISLIINEPKENISDRLSYQISKRTGISQQQIQDVLDAVYYANHHQEGFSLRQLEKNMYQNIEIGDTLGKGLNMTLDFGSLKVLSHDTFELVIYVFGDMASDIDVTVSVKDHSGNIISEKTIASFEEAYFAANEKIESQITVESLDNVGEILIDAEGTTGFSFLDLFL